jgi:hypothetical protein
MKNNKRKSLRRKEKRKNEIEKRRDEELYRIARIDPQTCEGQSILPIERLYKEKPINTKNNFFNSILSNLYKNVRLF